MKPIGSKIGSEHNSEKSNNSSYSKTFTFLGELFEKHKDTAKPYWPGFTMIAHIFSQT